MCSAGVLFVDHEKMELTGSILLCKDMVVFGCEECVRCGCFDNKYL